MSDKIKNIMCPTCKEITRHLTSVEIGEWVVDTCVICGSQWRVPPAPLLSHEAYDYE